MSPTILKFSQNLGCFLNFFDPQDTVGGKEHIIYAKFLLKGEGIK